MRKRKADYTAEEWGRYLALQRERDRRPERVEKRREYSSRPEMVEKRREHGRRPEVRAKRKELDNRPEARAKKREYKRQHTLRSAGLTPQSFADLMVVQNGKCGVCASPFVSTPHTDHCHDTATQRGLLCTRCNTAEGLIKKTGLTPQEFADRLQHYLDNPPALVLALV